MSRAGAPRIRLLNRPLAVWRLARIFVRRPIPNPFGIQTHDIRRGAWSNHATIHQAQTLRRQRGHFPDHLFQDDRVPGVLPQLRRYEVFPRPSTKAQLLDEVDLLQNCTVRHDRTPREWRVSPGCKRVASGRASECGALVLKIYRSGWP